MSNKIFITIMAVLLFWYAILFYLAKLALKSLVAKQKLEGQIEEVTLLKRQLGRAHLDWNGYWHYESKKIDNHIAERLATLTKQLEESK